MSSFFTTKFYGSSDLNVEKKEFLITNGTNRNEFHKMNPRKIREICPICVIRDKKYN